MNSVRGRGSASISLDRDDIGPQYLATIGGLRILICEDSREELATTFGYEVVDCCADVFSAVAVGTS